LWSFLFRPGRLVSARAHRGEVLVALRAGGVSLQVRLSPRDPARRCYARTATLDVVYDQVPDALERLVDAPMRALVAHLAIVDSPRT